MRKQLTQPVPDGLQQRGDQNWFENIKLKLSPCAGNCDCRVIPEHLRNQC